MLTHFGRIHLRPEWKESVVCIGTFDGVHRGHQEVIQTAVAEAARHEIPCALVTFDRHPASTLAPDRNPASIATLEQNLRAFRQMGVGIALVLPFDADMATKTAETFAAEILDDALCARHLVVGHDFALGRGRAGTGEWLAQRYDNQIVPPYLIDGQRVSSTAIRVAIAEGRVEDAAQWLGRPYALAGVVVGGQRLGRQLGYPTANLARPGDQILPADGVYATWVHLEGRAYRGATSIGMRPAVQGTHRTVETYLLDYEGAAFYGEALEVQFVRRIRPEANFDSLEALTAQIAADVAEARVHLSEEATDRAP